MFMTEKKQMPHQVRPFLAIAFLEGVAVLIIEVAGARALAPFFGASIKVWTAQITATLLCLALGYGAGGWLSKQKRSWDVPIVFCCAGIWLTAFPFLRVAVLEMSVKILSISQGSFLSSLLLFGLPLTCLGMVSPLLIERIDRIRSGAGSAAGSLFFTNTIGGLAGGWITVLVLIPNVSLKGALGCTGIVLVAVSVVWSFVQKKRLGAVFAGMLVVAVVSLFFLPQPQSSVVEKNGTRTNIIFSQQSNGGFIQVFDNETSGSRALFVDGVMQGGLVFPSGITLHPFTEYLVFLSKAYHPHPKTALVLGLGAGVVPRHLTEMGVAVTAVEIEPVVASVAKKYFEMPDAVEVVLADARTFINRTQKKYDLIFLDLFLGEKAPWYMTTAESLSQIRSLLAEGGVFLVNTVTWADAIHDPGLDALESAVAANYPQALVYKAQPHQGDIVVNAVVVAGTELIFAENAYEMWQTSKTSDSIKMGIVQLLNNRRLARNTVEARTDDWSDYDYLGEKLRGLWRKDVVASWGATILGD